MTDKGTTNAAGRFMARGLGLTGLATAIAVAGVVLAFSSAQVDARPNMVDKAHPCGSCHPPNKPPKR